MKCNSVYNIYLFRHEVNLYSGKLKLYLDRYIYSVTAIYVNHLSKEYVGHKMLHRKLKG